MRNGFSLLELSIVLVIIGLLAGGIMAGRSLIRASELRAVTAEYQRYASAVNNFQTQYQGLPGDFTTATALWGEATCPGVAANARTGTLTCNGNGNGEVVAQAGSNERFGFWQHLVNAGLISGRFSGVTAHAGTATDPSSTVGTNVPASKLKPGGWAVQYVGMATLASTEFVEGYYGHTFTLGGQVAGNWPGAAALSADDAFGIDSKIDDGSAGTGSVGALEQTATNCYNLANGTAGSASNSEVRENIVYQLGNSAIGCGLFFRGDF